MLDGSQWDAYIKHEKDFRNVRFERSTLIRIWGFVRPYRLKLLGLLCATVLISGLSLIVPLLLLRLIDEAIPNQDTHLVHLLGIGLVSIPILSGLLGILERWLNSRIGEGVIHDLRVALYEHVQGMSVRFYTKTRTGEILARFTNDIFGAQQGISTTLTSIMSNAVTAVAAVAIMFTLNWYLTLLSLGILPLFVISARHVAGVLRRYRRLSMNLMAEQSATLNETINLSGVILTKLFRQERRELARFAAQSRAVRDNRNREAVTSQWLRVLMNIVVAVASGAVYWAGGILILQGQFSLGTLIAFGGYIMQLYTPLIYLTNAPLEFIQSMVSFERVFEVLDIPHGVQELPGARALPEVEGKIRFQNVSFSYLDNERDGLPEIVRFVRGGTEAHVKRGKEAQHTDAGNPDEAGRWALRHLDFTIDPGQLVALVGPSGAGKTTVTYLIPRLYDPTEGAVLIDGHDTREVQLASLGHSIGMVTQDTYLFHDTIRANLLYARPDASDNELIAAASAANIHDFIASLPDGYDTVVGHRGYRLSGGERQRLNIARMVIKDPRILIFDEATSQLDSISEGLIQEALQRVMRGRTSIVIAHRLSTILAADRILVLDRGRLVEQGTHHELLSRGGLYKELHDTQFER